MINLPRGKSAASGDLNTVGFIELDQRSTDCIFSKDVRDEELTQCRFLPCDHPQCRSFHHLWEPGHSGTEAKRQIAKNHRPQNKQPCMQRAHSAHLKCAKWETKLNTKNIVLSGENCSPELLNKTSVISGRLLMINRAQSRAVFELKISGVIGCQRSKKSSSGSWQKKDSDDAKWCPELELTW